MVVIVAIMKLNPSGLHLACLSVHVLIIVTIKAGLSCCLAFAGGGSQQCCERNFCTMQSSQAILWLVAGL